MRSKLAILALCGFAVSAVCLGGAFALEPGPSQNAAWSWGFDQPRCDLAPSGQSATRRLAWDGSDSVGIAVPATVHYRRGQGEQVVVTGDSAVVSHVEIADGSVRFDCRIRGFNGVPLDVTLPGREFKAFGIAGRANMTLENIDQRDLALHMAGAGSVVASGKVESLELHVAGAGDAKLAGLAVNRLAIHVAGSSDIDASPKDDLKAHIVGSGTVTLHAEPRNIETHIIGSGRIIHADGSVSGNRHA